MTRDLRIEELSRKALSRRGLPDDCSAVLSTDNCFAVIKLGSWADDFFQETCFSVYPSAGIGQPSDDQHDILQIERGLDSLQRKG